MLHGCEAWSPTLREERRLRVLWVFENRILRRIVGPKRDANGEWRRLHNKELHSLYRSPNIVRAIKSRWLRWAGYVAIMEEGKSALKILTGKPTEKRSLGRPRRKWENNIRMDAKEISINTSSSVELEIRVRILIQARIYFLKLKFFFYCLLFLLVIQYFPRIKMNILNSIL